MAFPGRVEGFSPWFKLVVREPEGDITLGRFLSIMLERHGVEVIGLACAAAERAGVLKPLFMSGSARAARSMDRLLSPYIADTLGASVDVLTGVRASGGATVQACSSPCTPRGRGVDVLFSMQWPCSDMFGESTGV